MRDILDSVIDKLKSVLGKSEIKVLDSSCGDMNWMPGFLRARPGDVLYTGLDIVAANIEAHRKRFRNESWVFRQHDLVTDAVTSHDLVLCRHTLFHLKLSDIRRVLANFVASGSRYLLMTQQEQTCKRCWTMLKVPL